MTANEDEPTQHFIKGFGPQSESFRQFIHLPIMVQAQYEEWAAKDISPGENVTSAAVRLWLRDSGAVIPPDGPEQDAEPRKKAKGSPSTGYRYNGTLTATSALRRMGSG